MIEIYSLASSSRGNCYKVTDGKTPLLLECGLRYKDIQRRLNFNVSEVAACLVSHEHQDHARAVNDLMKTSIDCYMTGGTGRALSVNGHHRIKQVEPKEQFKVGTWTMMPFQSQHDAVEPVGFLLANRAGEKLLYATDTYYIRYRFRNLTHIMVEVNYSIDILHENVAAGIVPVEHKNRVIRSHFSLEHVKEFLKANDLRKVQEIWLLHMSDGNSDEQRFKREIQELTGKMVYVA